ncbi:hypothetical protein EAG21025_08330 [Enterobacter asburiae]
MSTPFLIAAKVSGAVISLTPNVSTSCSNRQQMATSVNKRDVITLDNGLVLNKIGPEETAE